MNHNALLNTAFKEVRACCQHLLQGFDRLASPSPSKHDKARFMHSIDGDIQHQLISKLKTLYPKHLFVAEEPSQEVTQTLPDHSDVWVIDPIDGSNNYMHHIPIFTISMCYYYKGERKAALVYDPINDELFTAIQGKGALRNQHRINTSQAHDLEHCILGVEGQQTFNPELASKVRTTRKLGCTSLTLCYVAAGRLDLAICQSPHLWDVAAGILIAEEAKALCYNQNFDAYQDHDDVLIVSNTQLKSKLEA